MNKLEYLLPFTFKEVIDDSIKIDGKILERLYNALKKDKKKGINIDLRGKLWNKEKEFIFDIEKVELR